MLDAAYEFFFSSRRRHTRSLCDWSSDVCSSDLVIHQQTSHNAHCPRRVVEQSTGQGVGWINRYLDREYVRRIADTTLRTYAHNLLHFVRWWESEIGRASCRERVEMSVVDVA